MTHAPTHHTISPAAECIMEMTNLALQMAAFDEAKHLKEREKQYCDANLITHGIYVIWETEDGWWRESIDFKGDSQKQIEKLKSDPTVAAGWINQARFDDRGGWYDPS